MPMTRDEKTARNRAIVRRVPGSEDVTVLGTEKPIAFRMRDVVGRNGMTLLCRPERGVINWNLWNTNQVPLSLTALTGADMMTRPLIVRTGWQKEVADWLASSACQIDEVDFDG